MFRVKLLAVVVSIFVAVVDELSLKEAETSNPPEKTAVLKKAPPKEIEKVQEPVQTPDIYTVTATVYFPERGQTAGNPLITADGSRINPKNPKKHRWIALSRDMLERWGGDIQYGDSIWVRGISEDLDGMYIVRDTMNRRFRNRIDILVGRRDKIMGLWDNVQIAKAEFPEEGEEQEVVYDFRPGNYGLAMSN